VEFGEAKAAQNEFHNYLILNRIFMPDELWEKFSSVDSQLSKALINFDVGKDANDHEMMMESAQIDTALNPAVKEVEKAVQKRLHYEEA
jgi:hypothetical protein